MTSSTQIRPLAFNHTGSFPDEPEGRVVSVSDPRVRVSGFTSPAPGALLVQLTSVGETALEVTLKTNRPLVRAQAATCVGQTKGNVPHSDRAVSLMIEAMSATACLIRFDATAHTDPMTQRGDNNG